MYTRLQDLAAVLDLSQNLFIGLNTKNFKVFLKLSQSPLFHLHKILVINVWQIKKL